MYYLAVVGPTGVIDMSWIIVEIESGIRKCDNLERDLKKLPTWPPKLKMTIAEAVSKCIVNLIGREYVEEIYYVDLSGGEPRSDFLGRDIDLIVKVKPDLKPVERDLEKILESHFNTQLYYIIGEVALTILKPDLIEIHVITSYDSYYGRLVRSPFTYAIRVWPPDQSYSPTL